MLKSASVLAAAVLAAAGFAGVGSAQAASISPANTGFTLSGTLTLSQSTTVNCVVSLTGTTNAAGTAATITSGSFSPGDWQCGWLVSPSSFPWTVSLTGGTGISISGIGANSILGNCSGVVGTTWTNPVAGPPAQPSSVSFSNHSIPGSPSTCYITGTLVSSPNLTVTP
ncbi:protein activator of alkane oxidation PraB [Caulobacter vibrioides]|nr:protein activator of alkane oxidation PraB [Caulobacter vibrioides]